MLIYGHSFFEITGIDFKTQDTKKGAFFPPASGVIFDAWPYTSELGCPNILIFIYFDFLLSKILCYDSPELLHNSA